MTTLSEETKPIIIYVCNPAQCITPYVEAKQATLFCKSCKTVQTLTPENAVFNKIQIDYVNMACYVGERCLTTSCNEDIKNIQELRQMDNMFYAQEKRYQSRIEDAEMRCKQIWDRYLESQKK